MEFNLNSLRQLILNKSVEISDGVNLLSSGEINLKIYANDDDVIISFDAPFPYVHVTKVGPKKLLNLIKPRVEYIKLRSNSKVLKLSSIPEVEIE